jgi:CO/xanthine dehydrogenase Mo-binding subunit/aerobic-type carbon monoxide dehydrogenase small subunit (CoxS/CutS family)
MESEITRIEINVNGKNLDVDIQPGEMLVDVLRNQLKLTGTKVGCNEAECGACTVLIDGEPILSCTYPAAKAHRKRIVTIEGLAQSKTLHPLQEAFILHGAVQCGFCIPGQIMTAAGLLLTNPDPAPREIRQALKDTLCRCGGYPTIERAVLAAAKSVRTGQPVERPEIQESVFEHETVGRMKVRPDAKAKVTGEAIYSDDLSFPGMLVGKVLRAGIPHGFLRRLNVEKARNLPGIITVMTAADIPGSHWHGLVIEDWPVLVGVGERVRYVGDSVAIVAAESEEVALQALALIEAEYEIRPVIKDAVQSRTEPEQLHPNGNMLKHIKVRKGELQQGFEASEIILEHTFHTVATDHAFIEPECSIAKLADDGRMEVYVGSQIPYSDRKQVAAALGWPEDRVRIVGMLIGGGFGGKEDIMGQIHAALLTWKTGRPVKILFDRHESLLVHPKRHATQIRVKMGATREGKLLSVETELYGDTGAYASLGEKVLTRATTHSSGPYEIPNAKADCYAMYTNNPPAGAFRGFGVTQSTFAIESMMDTLAIELNLDPVDLRRMNALKVGSVTNTGQILKDSVGLLECIDRVDAEMRRLLDGRNPFVPRIVEGEPNKVRAWGFAVAYKNTGLGGGAPDKAGAEIELYLDGHVEVRTSSAEIGQGLVTVLQLITAEELRLPSTQVSVLLSDTDLTPDGGPTTASRQTYVSGNAARHAARAMKEKISIYLAEKYDVPPDTVDFVAGEIRLDHKRLKLSDVAAEMLADNQSMKVLYEYEAPKTTPLGNPGDMHFAFSFAAQAAEIEVDQLTGEVQVLRVIAGTDVGSAINPLGLQGQIEGGIMMGLGNALTENFITEDGKVITDRLARYRVPGILLTPEITSIIVEQPVATGPFGAKGVGEIVSIPTTPAITNAIFNAVGVRVDHLPVDQEEIAMTIRNHRMGK